MRPGCNLLTKLTLSHLTVTIITILILDILIMVGYLLYLQTDFVARWAGVEAAYLADDISYIMAGDPLDPIIALEFIKSFGLVPILNEQDSLYIEPQENDWLIIFTPDYEVLASNEEQLFPPGMFVSPQELPGFTSPPLQVSWFESLLSEPKLPMSYTLVDEMHIGQAPILSPTGEVLGWVYFRAAFGTEPFTSTETISALLILLLGATIVATIISGLIGRVLAFSFSQRLKRLGVASAALAAGNLDQHVPIHGRDEIDQLGVQFNRMAGQLTSQMQQLRSLAERNAMLAEETKAYATLEERNRLARELHDAVKQQIFGLSLTAGSIRQLLSKDIGLAQERLAQLERQARDVHQEMDGIIRQLRPAALADRGLAAALGRLIDNWQEEIGLPVTLTISDERTLTLTTEQVLYRITQEALNNIARHAQAQHVEVTLQYETEQIKLRIVDDGCGFDPAATHSVQSLGLHSMKERAEEIGGHIIIRSHPGTGTNIMVKVQTTIDHI